MHKHEAEQYVPFVAINATPRAMNTREVEEPSATDDELHNVRRAIRAALMTANPICTTRWRAMCHRSFGVTRYTTSLTTTPGTSLGHNWHEAEIQN